MKRSLEGFGRGLVLATAMAGVGAGCAHLSQQQIAQNTADVRKNLLLNLDVEHEGLQPDGSVAACFTLEKTTRDSWLDHQRAISGAVKGATQMAGLCTVDVTQKGNRMNIETVCNAEGSLRGRGIGLTKCVVFTPKNPISK